MASLELVGLQRSQGNCQKETDIPDARCHSVSRHGLSEYRFAEFPYGMNLQAFAIHVGSGRRMPKWLAVPVNSAVLLIVFEASNIANTTQACLCWMK